MLHQNDNTTPMPAAEYDEKINKSIPAKSEQDGNGLYMKLTIPKRIIGTPAKGQKIAVVTGGAKGIGRGRKC